MLRAGQVRGSRTTKIISLLRDERDYLTPHAEVQVPRGASPSVCCLWYRQPPGSSCCGERLAMSSDAELVMTIAGKAVSGALPPATLGRLGGCGSGTEHPKGHADCMTATLIC
jgi:hypothetical protein